MYITLDIDLSMIPKDKIREGNNGHKYAKLTVSTMKQPDRFGNDMTVYMSQSKEERGKVDRMYVGKGKNWPERGQRQSVNDFPSDLSF